MKITDSKSSRLAALINEGNAESTRLYNELQAAKSLDKVAQKAISKKFTAASSKASALRSLAEMGEEFMAKRLEFAADSRKRAATYESPALQKRTLATAAKMEREYFLWCEYHGKRPTLLSEAATKPKVQKTVQEPAVKVRAPKHGGRRSGSGRKALGKKQLLLRVKPATVKRLKDAAKKGGFDTPGEWLDAQLEK